MNTKSQQDYWNKVAWDKTFTHPLNTELLSKYISKQAKILDFGCGYGRVVNLFEQYGYQQVIGIDTSTELIKRGLEQFPALKLRVLEGNSLPFKDNTFDLISIFAVLTCIPLDSDQISVIKEIQRVLKPGGVIYVSDYLLQSDAEMKHRYEQFSEKYQPYGIFEISEGAIFRHHQQDWFNSLFEHFNLENQHIIDVTTLQGGQAKGVQFMAVSEINC